MLPEGRHVDSDRGRDVPGGALDPAVGAPARPGTGRRPSGCGPVRTGSPGGYVSSGGRICPGPVTSASPSTGAVPSGEVTT